jgi:hypothetical protein
LLSLIRCEGLERFLLSLKILFKNIGESFHTPFRTREELRRGRMQNKGLYSGHSLYPKKMVISIFIFVGV